MMTSCAQWCANTVTLWPIPWYTLPSVTYLDSDLTRVDKQIAEALQRTARQRKLIERLRDHHHDTTSAEQLLKVIHCQADVDVQLSENH
jgi:hypothetical protein